ncbi:HD domain-containing protein [Deltaproteobacteria bacterium OttesenSCG-928-K17]|nr:HD domain-containing protein [Deltaproteobacteria bacterium OttesenSCG-928-K17]
MGKYSKFDLARGFSEVVDLVNNTLANHHLRVAFMADELARLEGFDQADRDLLLVASMLHDIGVIPLGSVVDDLIFETNKDSHARAGYLMVSACPLLRDEALIIKYHHTAWADIGALPEDMRHPARLANLIHLADMVDMQARMGYGAEKISRRVQARSGQAFSPAAAEGMRELLLDREFLENLTESAQNLKTEVRPGLMLSSHETTVFAMMFAGIIDARSSFTATHSTGVAHLALHLHQLAALPVANESDMFIAGLLHDIGKMGVPLDLLEKPGQLTDEEFRAVSRHAGLSEKLLASIAGFERITPWGAWHHERLNGRGYPNGLSGADIPMEARITAVADVLTALTESRPYRAGISVEQSLETILAMAAEGGLDGDVVGLVCDNLEEVNETRRLAQNLAGLFFKKLGLSMRPASGELTFEPDGCRDPAGPLPFR